MSHQDIAVLLERFASPDAEAAWVEFLESYADLIHQVAGLFERDEDRVAECFLFACEALQKENFRRLRRFRPGGPASFETWLRAVVRNLSIDWQRKTFGRSRLFKVIDELEPVAQQVFRCTYHLGLTALETQRMLVTEYPALTEDRVEEILADFQHEMSSRQQWLASTSRPIEESLEAGPKASDQESERPLATLDQTPEEAALDAENCARLAAALTRLSYRSRLVVQLRFEQDLSLKETARLMDLAGPQGAAREVDRALRELSRLMGLNETPGGSE